MSKLINVVPCCIKVFKQEPDRDGWYVEPTKNQMIDKLLEQHEAIRKYEAIEQELGIPLEVLFKALKNKKICGRKHHIYDGSTKEEYPLYNKPLYVNNVCLTNNEVFNRIQITYHSETLVGGDKESSGMVCYDLKDYGKTWALTREELEND